MTIDPAVLRPWVSLGDELAGIRVREQADWSAVDRMIAVVRPKLAVEAERLQGLLAQARKKLAPLEDPFELELGLHRWLSADREEAYSDWLEWIVHQARTPARVYQLFGLGMPPAGLPDTPELKRECPVPYGHEEHQGRLDLVIRYGKQALIVVEVKKGDGDAADTIKHQGYTRWLQEQQCAHPSSVFLATAAAAEAYEGFVFVSWQSVCIEMRRLAIALIHEQRIMPAALVLGFVAAVEQNLLGWSAGLVKGVCAEQIAFFDTQLVDHLARFVNES